MQLEKKHQGGEQHTNNKRPHYHIRPDFYKGCHRSKMNFYQYKTNEWNLKGKTK